MRSRLKSREEGLSSLPSGLEPTKAVCAIPALFCACAFINEFPYDKENREYIQNKKGLVTSPRLPNVCRNLAERSIYRRLPGGKASSCSVDD